MPDDPEETPDGEEKHHYRYGRPPAELRIENAVKPPPYSGFDDKCRAIATWEFTNARLSFQNYRPISLDALEVWMQIPASEIQTIQTDPSYVEILIRITRRHSGAKLPLLDEKAIEVIEKMLTSKDWKERKAGLEYRLAYGEQLGIHKIPATERDPDSVVSGDELLQKCWNLVLKITHEAGGKDCTCGAFRKLSPIRGFEELKRMGHESDQNAISADVEQDMGELQRHMAAGQNIPNVGDTRPGPPMENIGRTRKTRGKDSHPDGGQPKG